MDEKDFFDLTGLPYDGDNMRRIESSQLARAINRNLSLLREEHDDGSTSPSRKAELKAHIDLLARTRGLLLSANDTMLERTLYRAMMQKRVDQESLKLRQWVRILKASGRTRFTKGTINARRDSTGLSRKRIQDIFESEGLILTDIAMKRPAFPMNSSKILSDLIALQRMSSRLQPSATSEANVYSGIAFMVSYIGVGSNETAEHYRQQSTQSLRSTLRGLAADAKLAKASVDDELGNLCKGLANALETQVLDSDENRRDFDIFVVYSGSAMTELFANLKQATPNELREPALAESFLQQMRTIFRAEFGEDIDESTLLSMYNTQARIIDDEPYFPEKVVTYVQCALHGCMSDFETMQEAYTVNKCKVCGAQLFKECSACHQMVKVSATVCPMCGAAFPDKALALKHFHEAELAMQRYDFPAAEASIAAGVLADPAQSGKAEYLRNRLLRTKEDFNRPLLRLREHISQKKFGAAEQLIRTLKQDRPALGIQAEEAAVQKGLEQARKVFDEALHRSVIQRIKAAEDALDRCIDYSPALQFLQSTPPLPSKSISVSVDSERKTARLRWARSDERQVTYTVVRGRGKIAPTHVQDRRCDILAEGLSANHWEDPAMQEGTMYTYAVFVVRQGLVSERKECSAQLMSKVTNIRFVQKDGALHFTWDSPLNCSGIRVMRAQGNERIVVAEAALDFFTDTKVQLGNEYTYTFQTIYQGVGESEGVSMVCKTTPKVEPYSIGVDRLRDDMYRVSWPAMAEVALRVYVGGAMVREQSSSTGYSDIELLPNSMHLIHVLAESEGKWLQSRNTVEVSTFSPCEIDQDMSKLYETARTGADKMVSRYQLHVVMEEPFPSNVTAFHYFVRPDTVPVASRWASEAEVREKAPDMRSASIEDYGLRRGLVASERSGAETAYYVTVFTAYDAHGNTILSAPSRHNFAREIVADIYWSYDQYAGQLCIDIRANIPLSRRPSLVLRCRPPLEARQELRRHGKNADDIQLAEIPGEDLLIPQASFQTSFTLDASIRGALLQYQGWNLAIAALHSGTNQFTPRLARGYDGKVR